jgi:type II secretory pathway component PulF
MKDDLIDIPPSEKGTVPGSIRSRLIAHGTAWWLFLMLSGFGMPRTETIFADFGIPMPQLTILAIRASHSVVGLVSSILVLLGVDWFVLDALSRRGDVGRSRSWSALMVATPLVMIVLTLVAMSLPLFGCRMRLSG